MQQTPVEQILEKELRHHRDELDGLVAEFKVAFRSYQADRNRLDKIIKDEPSTAIRVSAFDKRKDLVKPEGDQAVFDKLRDEIAAYEIALGALYTWRNSR